MPKPITLPKNIGELAGSAADIARAEQTLNALSNLQVTVQLPDGTRLTGTVQIAGNGASVLCQPSGGTAKA